MGLVIVALVLGSFLTAFAVVRVQRLWRVRRTLQAVAWVTETGQVVSLAGKVAQTLTVIALNSGVERVLLKMPITAGDSRFGAGPEKQFVVAHTTDGRWALARDPAARPIPVKELRKGRLYNRVVNALVDG